jgi:hypothetical protein
MPQDNKYGKVTLEKGTVGETEPVFVLRAQDKIVPVLLNFYYQKCREMGSPQHHLEKIEESTHQIIDWQAKNFTKIPTSDDSASTPGVPVSPEER